MVIYNINCLSLSCHRRFSTELSDKTMTKKGLKRKLTAILSTDVEGYSRVMGYDEAKGRPSTIASLGQKVMETTVVPSSGQRQR